ncbi:hypothetical protein [Micromonospora sp. NBC_01796]|uniref:hypothetical protein n=1 Tax=Micromonospora sp. NBC_01796 TaxID=2975987 RepID=UPI002DD8276A|nr:hypothetical protein [Micromonospora sp. NBC_01796]WSA85315.1 hypothetical protein OIE47_34010 [Micromonospora sp. NBC_01796]
MSQPEESREKSPKTDAVLQPPTANPDRTQLRGERDRPDRDDADRDEGDPGEDDPAGTSSTSRKER